MELPLLGEGPWLLLLLCTFLTLIYYYSTYHIGIWEKVGVPGPRAYPIVHHLLEMTDGLSNTFDRWQKKYGRTYGTYGLVSKSPTLITTDSKLIHHVLVKDFNNFTDRHLGDFTRASMLKGLIFQNGSDFRRHRHALSPSFTGGRLRIMLHHTNESADCLISLIKKTKAKGGLIPLKRFAEKFSSDVIAKTGFGVQADAVAEEDNEFSKYVASYFTPPTLMQQICRALSTSFPFLMSIGIKLFPQIDAVNKTADEYFMSLAKVGIDRIREEKRLDQAPSAPRDMLDIFSMSDIEDTKSGDADKKLSTDEIIGNSTTLILAAYETTSRTVMAALYLLAGHQDIQDKVIEEIDRVLDGKTQPTYDQLSELKYAEQVIYEAMRLFPPMGTAGRKAAETKVYEGVTIPKGTNVMIPIFQVLMDPEYFPDPHKFDPDRFGKEQSKNRDAILDLQFGYGPRLCIGKRLALLEVKALFCHMFSQMRFIQSDRTVPKTGEELEMQSVGFAGFLPKKPIELDIVLRQ